MTVTVGVLALQGDVREHVHALSTEGATAVPVRRVAELDAVDALVIPGGSRNRARRSVAACAASRSAARASSWSKVTTRERTA